MQDIDQEESEKKFKRGKEEKEKGGLGGKRLGKLIR